MSSKHSEIVSFGRPFILIVFAKAFIWEIIRASNIKYKNQKKIYFHIEVNLNLIVQ